MEVFRSPQAFCWLLQRFLRLAHPICPIAVMGVSCSKRFVSARDIQDIDITRLILVETDPPEVHAPVSAVNTGRKRDWRSMCGSSMELAIVLYHPQEQEQDLQIMLYRPQEQDLQIEVYLPQEQDLQIVPVIPSGKRFCGALQVAIPRPAMLAIEDRRLPLLVRPSLLKSKWSPKHPAPPDFAWGAVEPERTSFWNKQMTVPMMFALYECKKRDQAFLDVEWTYGKHPTMVLCYIDPSEGPIRRPIITTHRSGSQLPVAE